MFARLQARSRSALPAGNRAGVSQAATVPRGTPSKAVVVERNKNNKMTNYKLQNADPMTGK